VCLCPAPVIVETFHQSGANQVGGSGGNTELTPASQTQTLGRIVAGLPLSMKRN